jgi:hypothetical protein
MPAVQCGEHIVAVAGMPLQIIEGALLAVHRGGRHAGSG